MQEEESARTQHDAMADNGNAQRDGSQQECSCSEPYLDADIRLSWALAVADAALFEDHRPSRRGKCRWLACLLPLV